jgi:hypothetical protein
LREESLVMTKDYWRISFTRPTTISHHTSNVHLTCDKYSLAEELEKRGKSVKRWCLKTPR